MLNRLVVVFVVLLALAGGRASRAAAPGSFVVPEMQGITVGGHADIIATPDIAYVSLGVVTQDKDQNTAVALNSTNMHAVIESLHNSGVVDKDIQTENYNVQAQYDYHTSPPVLTGYQVTNSLRATVRDLTKAGSISDKAVTAGANQVGGISFDIADKTQVQAEALARAIMDARLKAQVAAKAAGVGLGRMLNLSEGATQPVQPIYFGARAAGMQKEMAATPIESNQIHVVSDVTMLFAVDYSSH